jgi:hypothetical protein
MLMQLCDEILLRPMLDEAVLHPLKIVLKELHRGHDIRRVYEAAHEHDPGNVEVMEALFGAYVRQVQAHQQT